MPIAMAGLGLPPNHAATGVPQPEEDDDAPNTRQSKQDGEKSFIFRVASVFY
jgi:hypothetical protein